MSLFKRLLNPNYKSEEKAKRAETSEHSKYYPEQNFPIDERFTYNFKNNGGKFIYCLDNEELQEAFDNILMENDWYEQEAFCIDKMLISKFNGFNISFVKNSNATFLFGTCESLVSNNGSILLSSNQLAEKKLNELPQNFIIFATTSKIVETISEGLRIIKSKSGTHIPSNITTIQDFEMEKEKDFMSYGNSPKNLYLLLLEDL